MLCSGVHSLGRAEKAVGLQDQFSAKAVLIVDQ